MSFRETEESAASTTGRVARRWLREVLFEDWGLKLLALLITLGLWYGVTSQHAPVTIRLRGVQLYFLRPDDVEISNDPREEVEVTLQGSSSALNDLVMRNLVLTVDVSKYKLGERVVPLARENVSMNLPEGVRIEKIEPNRVALRLERSVEREVEVEARLEGHVPPGFEVRGVEVTPRRVRVRGPESHVKTLEKVPTETISLDGQSESLRLPQTAIDIVDQKVASLDPVVAVRVEIGEERIERHLEGVAVRAADENAKARPARAAVVVRGARSLVEKLRPEELELILEPAPDGTLQPRLRLPPGLEGRVELVSTTPASFSINS